MAQESHSSPGPTVTDGAAVVRLTVSTGKGRPTVYEVGDGGFLIGSVPGCDLRLPGVNLAPVLCLIARQQRGASVRKLAPVQPILVNGQSITSTYLADGDRVVIGPVELTVAIAQVAALEAATPDSEADSLRDQAEQLAEEKALWEHRREEIETECRVKEKAREELHARLLQQEHELEVARAALAEREARIQETQEEAEQRLRDIQAQVEEVAREKAEAAQARRELHGLREQLYERYRERRDKLTVKQEAVRRAARRVLEAKKQWEAESTRLASVQQEWEQRQNELEGRAEQVARERQLLEDQLRLITSRQQEVQRELAERLREIEAREKQQAEDRAALEKGQKQHQADLVRLDRIQATLEQRQKGLQTQALEIDRRFEQLQRDTRELEEQANQLDEWHQRLVTDNERLEASKKEHEGVIAQLDQRAAALEGQQAMLATLRTRLERMREEVRRQEESLSDQRVLQEASEKDLQDRLQEAQRLRAEAENDRQLQEQERRRFDESRVTLETAVARLRAAQESLAAQEAEVQQRQQQVEASAAEQAESAAMLVARAEQLDELTSRVQADRQALRDREVGLARAEQALAALQEQVRKRSEELNERQRLQEEEEKRLEQENAALEQRVQTTTQDQQLAEERLGLLRRELAARSDELTEQARLQEERETELRTSLIQMEELRLTLHTERQTLSTERFTTDMEMREAREQLEKGRADLEAARNAVLELARGLPDLEARAAEALDKLARAREQLREQLGEMHAYGRQSREELEAARRQVQAEIERVRQAELDLNVARDEHRLAVAAFRQQVSEWQGKVGEIKQTLLADESRLERRQAELEEQARQMAQTSAQLSQQTEELQKQKQQVVERRGEMDRHLVDMREWYRRKLRELAGIDLPEGESARAGDGAVVVPLPASVDTTAPASTEDGATEPERGILSMTGELDAGDRQLGDLLRSLELVDADTLMALLMEARRQRRSLRQLMLAGGYLTLYQIALIEAGNLDGLVLGPVRVIDRLQSTTHEAAYRVFDPRRNGEALLRHLAEEEMHDAVRPDEFRQRFGAAAAVQHVHLAATLELLEIGGRPAVLQEWLTGLPSADWPALASAPGVWFRLVSQAALALQTIHGAGLVHGHLQPTSFVCTGEGILKLCGLGEPRWLVLPPLADDAPVEGDAAADLLALGKIAAGWAALAPQKGKAKALPKALAAIRDRLLLEEGEERYSSAAALLEDLDRVSGEVPANAEAWDRFVRQVREQSATTALRESA